jgi:epoxyqueuosine reductase
LPMSKDEEIEDYIRKHGNGCDCRLVKAEHLDELREELESRKRLGLIDETLYAAYLSSFKYRKPKCLPSSKSIVIMSVPQPSIRIGFNWRGIKHQLIVPPTYVDVFKITNYARLLLMESVKPAKYKFVKCFLPLKILAVRSGLAMYGRNNITYVPKYGSYHRLVAFFTDYCCEGDNWQDARSLPLCKTCMACINACPTGAIKKDHFHLSAEKCITYYSELPANENPFPEWLDYSSYGTIIGCMLCQDACPCNRNVDSWVIDRCDFSQKETEYLISGNYANPLKSSVERKLRKAGLDLSIFPRNLEAHMVRKGCNNGKS